MCGACPGVDIVGRRLPTLWRALHFTRRNLAVVAIYGVFAFFFLLYFGHGSLKLISAGVDFLLQYVFAVELYSNLWVSRKMLYVDNERLCVAELVAGCFHFADKGRLWRGYPCFSATCQCNPVEKNP